MDNSVLKVRHLCKQYEKNARPAGSNLREDLALWWNYHTNFRKSAREKTRYVQALDDVHFELDRGDILGIVGRNGAGKSTLLKILAGIVQPTSGVVSYRGRLVSILELGAGFHPDLSGRENVFLNGALLGMSRSAIKKQFDAIVAFSELDAFIDQPVKHYSSGMYLRLAFSVFTHLESDILLLDEVLSVGDLPFQQKSHSRIVQLAGAGVTILLVNHNPDQLKELCNKCLWIEKGAAAAFGTPVEVVNLYLEKCLMPEFAQADDSPIVIEKNSIYWKDGLNVGAEINIFRVGLHAKNKLPQDPVTTGDVLEMEIEFEKLNAENPIGVGFSILSMYGAWVLADSCAMYPAFDEAVKRAGRYVCRCSMPAGILNFGFYQLGILVSSAERLIYQNQNLFNFRIHFLENAAVKNHLAKHAGGIIKPPGIWEIKQLAL